jgi:hypothetical protein
MHFVNVRDSTFKFHKLALFADFLVHIFLMYAAHSYILQKSWETERWKCLPSLLKTIVKDTCLFWLVVSCVTIRGHSQTTFTRFGFFWPPTPLRFHFLWYKSLQKVDFLTTYPPPLVNVVCERPLRLCRCFFSKK